MFHGDIVAAMEALPIVTRYPLEMSNLKYSSSRLPHGNYRCPKFHGAAPFSIVERLLSRLDRQGGRERDRERERERERCACGKKKVSSLFAAVSPSTINEINSLSLFLSSLSPFSLSFETLDRDRTRFERHCRSAALSPLIQISRAPLDINHSLPSCRGRMGTPYVHTQQP